MKKRIITRIGLAIFVVGLCATLPTSSNAWYLRITSGGGSGGFDKTSKYKDNNGNTLIECSGSGHTGCPSIAYNPNEGPGADTAMARIASGDLSDSYTDLANGTTTTWTSDDVYGDNSVINIAESASYIDEQP